MTKFVAAVSIPDNAVAYQANSALKGSTVAQLVEAVAILERDENGNIRIPEGFDTDAGSGFGIGGLVGALVGILGGPLGVLLGWGLGASTGAIFDADRSDQDLSALQEISDQVPAGRNALVLETNEDDTAALDGFFAEYDGTVVRRPLDEVLAEAEAADAAAADTQRAAHAALKAQKKEERHEKHEERIANLRAKFA